MELCVQYIDHIKLQQNSQTEIQSEIHLPCYTRDEANNQLKQLFDLYTNTLQIILSDNGANQEQQSEIIDKFQFFSKRLQELTF